MYRTFIPLIPHEIQSAPTLLYTIYILLYYIAFHYTTYTIIVYTLPCFLFFKYAFFVLAKLTLEWNTIIDLALITDAHSSALA